MNPSSALPWYSPRACSGLREGEQRREVGDPHWLPPSCRPGAPLGCCPLGPCKPACLPSLALAPTCSSPASPAHFCASLPCWMQPEDTSLLLCCSCSEEVANQLLLVRCMFLHMTILSVLQGWGAGEALGNN